MTFIKEYLPTIFKTMIYIIIIFGIIFAVIFGGSQTTEYFTKQAIMDDYLISKNKIVSLTPKEFSFKPTKFELVTDDGIYSVGTSLVNGIENLTTLTGENFETRKKVIEELEKKEIENVKRGSLKYLGKNTYEAFDFDTKHYFTVKVDSEGNIDIQDKEVK